MDEQKTNICFEIETTHGEDVLKSVEITRKDLEYYINSVDQARAVFERIDSNFESSSIVNNNIKQHHILEKLFVKGRLIDAINFILILRNCHNYPNL